MIFSRAIMRSSCLIFLVVITSVISLSSGTFAGRKCPAVCSCSSDGRGRLQTICSKGGMREIPVNSIDSDVEILIIKGPRNSLTIGPIFEKFSRLQTVRIVESNVPAIGIDSFRGVISLKVLDLSQNNITTLHMDDFRRVTHLQELDLSKNKLQRMPSGTFHRLQELIELNLSNNFIEELVTRTFLRLAKLKILNLSNNPIRELQPEVFKDVQGLRILNLRNCQIGKVNPQLYNLLNSLTELDLGENQFKYFDEFEFKDLKKLKTLRLDGNQLSVVVDYIFQSQRSLEFLDISRNRLAKITPMAFENLNNLTYLDLSYNKFTELDMDTVNPLANLRTLNISGNINLDLVKTKAALQMLPELYTLSLADLSTLPKNVFGSVSQIRELNLSGNHLNSASLHILSSLGNLDLLDLSRNQLNGIGERLSARLLRISDVRLDNNPLICDRCHMGPLIDRMANMRWPNYSTCFLPEALRGVPLSEIDPLGLEWCIHVTENEDTNAASTSFDILVQSRQNLITIGIGAIVIILALVFLIFVAVYTRHRARYYTHEDKMEPNCEEKNGLNNSCISNSEINFKFPMNDHICTIDDYILPPPPPPTVNTLLPSLG